MIRATQYIDYIPPNESTRVRWLLKSITCSALESTKNVISNDAGKKGDFELTTDYFKGTNAEYKYNEEVIGDKESWVLDCIYSIDTVDAFEE